MLGTCHFCVHSGREWEPHNYRIFFFETRQLHSALFMALEIASEDEVVLTYFLLSRYSLPTAEGVHLKNVIV